MPANNPPAHGSPGSIPGNAGLSNYARKRELKLRILAKHKWLVGVVITESDDETKSTKTQAYRRFTATIRGWRNWRLFEGPVTKDTVQIVIDKAKSIRARIDTDDKTVFET